MFKGQSLLYNNQNEGVDMFIGMVGLNAQVQSFQSFEKVSHIVEESFEELETTIETGMILLLTCNRVEIYFCSDSPKRTYILIKRFLTNNELVNESCKFYSLFNYDCIIHLCRLASGLISPIFGESAVFAQVKKAYQLALDNKKIPKQLNVSFQKALHVAKEVRSEFGLNDIPSIISRAILQESEKYFDNLEDVKLLFIGYSKINHEIMAYFKKIKKTNTYLINRTADNAKYAIEAFHLNFIEWNRLNEWTDFDFIISGVTTGDFILSSHEGLNHLKTKLIVDLGVPHNVNPLLGKIPNLMLINMDAVNKLCVPFFERLFRLYTAADKYIVSKLANYINRHLLELSRDFDSDNVDFEIFLSTSNNLKVKR